METKKLIWERPALRELGGIGELTSGQECYGGGSFLLQCDPTGSGATGDCQNGDNPGGGCSTGNIK
jgi:hypothetical protein